MSIATYAHTPSSPWALPTLNAHPRIYFTPTRLARFRALWASPTANFTQLKSQVAADTSGMGKMVQYMATRLTDPTGAANLLTLAYNSAVGQTYSLVRTSATSYADTSSFIFDWGYADLTGPQKTALIAQLESFNAQREATSNNGMLAGIGQEQGYTGYALGVLAIEGESGATSRIATLRNMVQNLSEWMDEGMGDGWWHAYPHEQPYFHSAVLLPYHIAGNQENLIAGRCAFIANRANCLAYRTTSGGWNPICSPTDQHATGSVSNAAPLQDGTNDFAKAEMGFNYAMYADVLNDGVAQTMANAVSNQSASFKWTTGTDNQTVYPAFMAMIFYNTAITPTPVSSLPNSAIFPRPGHVAFRSGWTTPTTTVRGWLHSTPHFSLTHDTHYAGCFEAWRGDDMLICNQYTYAGQPCAWQNGTQTATEVGTYSMCRSTLLFSPTGSATPDRSGSQKHVMPAGSAAAYPIANTLSANSTWLAGTVGNFSYGGAGVGHKTQATATYTNAYYPNTDVTSVNRVVAYVNGATEAKGTFFVQDNFTLVPGSVDRIRALWGCRAKPVGMTSETVVTGASLAGVMTYPNQPVKIQWRNSQATIQMVSPTPTVLRLVGGGNGVAGAPAGPGYESYFDGANLDYHLNGQSGRTVGQERRIQGVWRIEHETTPAAANGQMLFAITVDDIGTTAPTYTQAQVLAIISGSGGGGAPTMPGMTQLAQRATLDNEFSVTRYCALFSTVPNDDGTGGTELTGNGYARIAVLSTDWAAATGGGPASKSNAVAKAFAAASGGDWLAANGFGFFDASTSGNLRVADYMGNFTWEPFTCTSASPGVLRSAAHGLTTGDKVLVTNKYGGVLPITAGSWSGIKTATVLDADTFTVAVDTTGTGDGQFRKVVSVTVTNGQTWTWAVGDLKVTQG